MEVCQPYLATASYDGHICIWNMESLTVMHRVHAPDLFSVEEALRPVESVRCPTTHNSSPLICVQLVFVRYEKPSPVRADIVVKYLLLAGSADARIRIYNPETGQFLLHLKTGLRESISAMCTDAKFQLLVLADAAGNIQLFDIARLYVGDGAEARQLVGKKAWIAHNARISRSVQLRLSAFLILHTSQCLLCRSSAGYYYCRVRLHDSHVRERWYGQDNLQLLISSRNVRRHLWRGPLESRKARHVQIARKGSLDRGR